MKKIKKAGVLGAGVMGATIAAQLANVGIETLLLDIVPPQLTEEDIKKGLTVESKEFRNKLSKKGLESALNAKPAAFYIPEYSKLITIGNMEDDFDKLKEVDWIIEVVVERLDIKQKVFEKVEGVLRPDMVVSSNTSGISAKSLCEGRSELFRKRFAITHFFNPPRYMKLLELVPGPDTDPEVMEILKETCEKVVGKGIVYAKDTPNFIANRIGTFSMMYAIRTMMELGLSVEEVDALTGPVIGHPKTASFRTADLVGLDTLLHVANNVYEGAKDDPQRELFRPPEFLHRMVEKNLLGDKTKQGFYKKTTDQKGEKIVLSLDYNTLEYRAQKKVKFPSLESAKNLQSTEEKFRTLFYAEDLAGQFTFKTTAATFLYSADRIPEIADDIVNLDNAMKWGFAWKVGPFEA
ncbi:MAG: 3-hydroxyacyl-CoA dehydrogenase family protein, partial [Desulfatiglandales bacterium]